MSIPAAVLIEFFSVASNIIKI